MAAKKKNSGKSTAIKGNAKKRTPRPYPASSFEDALELADAIQKVAAGEKVRRLTLLKAMNRSDTSSSTQMLITNSGKYGITKGTHNHSRYYRYIRTRPSN